MSENPKPPDPLLSDYSNEPDMIELVQGFVEGLTEKVEKIRSLLAEQDLAGLSALVHQLKGSAGMYGFMPITQAASDLRQMLDKKRDLAKVAAQCAALTDLCERARATPDEGTHKDGTHE